jgi:hypothetical protein
MSRPRLSPEQKKVSFSLAFSPNLIAALEKVRGAKSQSVFVEEWLRQHPQIAAELAAMRDPGFVPPVVYYERLMQRLYAFYSPADDKVAALARVLFIAHKIISRNPGAPAEVERQIATAMEELWLQDHHRRMGGSAREPDLAAVRPAIQEYARYYYQVIFLEMAKGERALLRHRFRSLVHGCEAVHREHLRQAGNSSLSE